MKIKAELSISKVSGGARYQSVSITVHDAASGCEFLRLEISLEDYAKAITNTAHVPCDGEYRPDAPVGKRREVKTEQIEPPDGFPRRDQYAVAAAPLLAPFEIDGWKGYAEDLFNGHRRGKDGRHSVTFVRYVD